MYAVLEARDFPLQAWQRLRPSRPEVPVAVAEAGGRQSLLVALNGPARAARLNPGMRVGQARGRCPSLEVWTRDPAVESAARETFLLAALELSPSVEDTALGVVSVDLSGHREMRVCAGLLKRFVGQAEGLGLRVHAGMAMTPGLALFAARSCADADVLRVVENPGEFLAGTPVPLALAASAGADTVNLLRILGQWGIRTLGQFAGLPRAEVARRLGQEGAALWDQTNGRDARLLKRWEPPARYAESLELEHEVEHMEALLFVLRRMLEQLCLKLSWACQYARMLRLEIVFADGSAHQRRFELPEPTREADMLLRVLHLHLESLRAPAAVAKAGVELQPTDPPQRQGGLFESGVKDVWRFTETHAQLVGLVGAEHVGSPRLLDSHRPDAWSLVPLPRSIDPLDTESSPLPAGLPLRRLRPPRKVGVRQSGKIPAILVLEGEEMWKLADARGPYCGSGGWWERGLFWKREEWDVLLGDGRLCRLFRCGESWYLEGFYG